MDASDMSATSVDIRGAGFTMIEVLVSVLIIALGLLGLAGMQSRMQQAEFESYQRSQALVLLHDMVDRININRLTASCFAISDGTATAAVYGTNSNALPACGFSTAANNAVADAAIAEWDSLLKGSGETKNAAQVGAMIGARGCVNYSVASEVANPAGGTFNGTGIYTVAVSWQGIFDTVAPSVNCGNNQYATETRRRTVSTSFRLGCLKC
jgi:type IV pilus assembly protein PilV